MNSPKALEAMSKSEEFKEWFLQNYFEKEVYDRGFGGIVTKYQRIAIWTPAKPLKKEHYKKTTLIHPVTGKPLIIEGVPGGKYSYPKVKDEYRTVPRGAKRDQYVGKVIDNKGNYLPKDTVADSPYINKDFVQQEQMNTDEYKFIKAYTDSLLYIQKNISKQYLREGKYYKIRYKK